MGRIRKPAILAIVVLVLVGWAEAAVAGPVTAVRFAGSLATADWTSCPVPAVGLGCTDTEIVASDSSLKETGSQRSAGPHLIYRRFEYVVVEVDGSLAHRPVRETIGGTDAATVSIQPRLEAAEASAAVPVQVCSFDPNGEATCVAGSVSVAASWVGGGQLQRLDEQSVQAGPGVLVKSYTVGWQRLASATASADGSMVPGVQHPDFPPMLVSARQGEVTVCHGGC